MGNYVKVATVDQVPGDHGILVEAGGQRIALFKLGDGYYAIGDTCTHRGGPLSEGFLTGDQVICPWHGANFDVKTGKVLTPPAPADVPHYAVRVVGNDIEVEV